jgi:hypothetical protein
MLTRIMIVPGPAQGDHVIPVTFTAFGGYIPALQANRRLGFEGQPCIELSQPIQNLPLICIYR